MSTNPARDFALVSLDSKALPNWAPRRLSQKFASQVRLPADPRDRALAEQIEAGVIKNLLQLQYWTARYADRPLAKIHPVLQKILAIAIYQLRFLDRVPVSAAVNEAVDQTKRFGLKHAAGFVNAVLRKATSGKADTLEAPDAAAQAQLLWSHPTGLFARLCALVGEEKALEICRHDNQQPPTIVRLCAGRTLADFTAAGALVTPHEQPQLAVIQDADKALLARLAREGIAQVQDPTAAKVIEACGLQEGMSVLDRCCGMGTKTLQAWEKVGAASAIVAIDPAEARCDALRQMLVERRITNVRVIQSAEFPQAIPDLPPTYNCVLVDVPCSNSGVLARRPEARYTQSAKPLQQLQQLQQKLIKDAAARLGRRGRLVYSTCSIWPEENHQIVAWLLDQNPELQLFHEETTLPSTTSDPATYHDGGYYAVITRHKRAANAPAPSSTEPPADPVSAP
jgi:16S rRNA (cytosine967-C5)-methyltransferase